MTMPGFALSTPASHVPAVVVTTPLAYSAVCSPKYQTLPLESSEYQSVVFSTSDPLLVTTSVTVTHLTPMIVLFWLVTLTTVLIGAPSLIPLKVWLVPGIHGVLGLGVLVENWEGAVFGV